MGRKILYPADDRGRCNGAVQGSRVALFVSADWQVRMFWLYGILDIPYDRLYLHTITLSGCMDICSCYIQFYYQS